MARGLDAGKYFWRSGREKCFSLDIPFNRTSGQTGAGIGYGGESAIDGTVAILISAL
jgi:hypothetical protein